jgi:hypothetical protein
MSARFASPVLPSDFGYIALTPMENPSHHLIDGPPPGLSYPQAILPSPVLSISHGYGNNPGQSAKMNASAHGECLFHFFLRGECPRVSVPSTVLSQCGRIIGHEVSPVPVPLDSCE